MVDVVFDREGSNVVELPVPSIVFHEVTLVELQDATTAMSATSPIFARLSKDGLACNDTVRTLRISLFSLHSSLQQAPPILGSHNKLHGRCFLDLFNRRLLHGFNFMVGLAHDKRSIQRSLHNKTYEKVLKRVSKYMFAVEICDGRCVSVLDQGHNKIITGSPGWPVFRVVVRALRSIGSTVPTWVTLTRASAHQNTVVTTDIIVPNQTRDFM
jgi:hypothetical protein